MPKAKYKRRKDGRYYTKISVGYDLAGKMVRKNVYGRTLRELENNISELRHQIDSGTLIKTNAMSLQDYARTWNNTYNSIKSINTRAMYTNIIEKHIIPELGHIPLCKLYPSDVQALVNAKMEKRRTCEQILLVMKQINRSAVSEQLMIRDVCLGVNLPPKVYSEKRTLTKLEKDALKKAAFTEKEKTFVMILYAFGLRRGEALALTKNDFNFKRGTLTVRQSIAFDQNNPVVKPTKTESGFRTLDIPTQYISLFTDYIRELNTIYLFTKQDGSIMTKSSYDKMWKSIIAKMNDCLLSDSERKMHQKKIKHLTAHIFRHDYCTSLYYSGISIKKAVALMGHSDTKMIMDVYAHLDEEKENAKEKINLARAL